jgi:uncharacterized oxidoreductase
VSGVPPSATAGASGHGRLTAASSASKPSFAGVIEAMLPLVDAEMTAGPGRGKISADAAARAILAGLERDDAEIRVTAARMLAPLVRRAPSAAYRMLRDG